jgi:hypothetical protein
MTLFLGLAGFAAFNFSVVADTIEEQQTTSAYLDGSGPPEGSRARPGDKVRLPDGEIVGWAADATAE